MLLALEPRPPLPSPGSQREEPLASRRRPGAPLTVLIRRGPPLLDCKGFLFVRRPRIRHFYACSTTYTEDSVSSLKHGSRTVSPASTRSKGRSVPSEPTHTFVHTCITHYTHEDIHTRIHTYGTCPHVSRLTHMHTPPCARAHSLTGRKNPPCQKVRSLPDERRRGE